MERMWKRIPRPSKGKEVPVPVVEAEQKPSQQFEASAEDLIAQQLPYSKPSAQPQLVSSTE
jgi:hypothetical protein